MPFAIRRVTARPVETFRVDAGVQDDMAEPKRPELLFGESQEGRTDALPKAFGPRVQRVHLTARSAHPTNEFRGCLEYPDASLRDHLENPLGWVGGRPLPCHAW